MLCLKVADGFSGFVCLQAFPFIDERRDHGGGQSSPGSDTADDEVRVEFVERHNLPLGYVSHTSDGQFVFVSAFFHPVQAMSSSDHFDLT